MIIESFMKISDFHHIHFTGIKGVGLTALALCAQDLGMSISGSDTADEFVTDPILKKRGIRWEVGFDPRRIFALSLKHSALSLVIYTAAHKGPNNPEVTAAQAAGIPCVSYAEALGVFMQGKTGISICGVGGKSTTSAMVATILEYARLKPSYAIGVGNIPCLGTPGKYDKKGKHFVAEADEYFAAPGFDDTPKFLYQNPQIIGVTNIRYDHPDVYPNFESTCSAYQTFFNKLPQDGLLVAGTDSLETLKVVKTIHRSLITYGSHPKADLKLKSYHAVEGKALFTASFHGIDHEFVLHVPGKFNAINALCAFAIATELGIDPRTSVEALKTFTGTMRRFEIIGKTKSGATIVDDYAHHPSEIQATLKAAKEWLPGKKIIAIFQPHTFSRTKALFADFANSFTDANEAIILPIYASAREAFDPEVSSQQLVEAMQKRHPKAIYLETEASLIKYLGQINENDVILTLGAGDIFLLGKKLQRQL